MRVLANKNDLSRDEWLKIRQQGIGGSDAPVIVLDDFPWKTRKELWEEKSGIIQVNEDSPAMMRGRYLEDIIAQIYTEKTGRKLRRVNRILQSEEHPFMIANVDREIVGVEEKEGTGILEIKCPGLRTFARCKREGLSDYYQVQLQHYLSVAGKQWGAFAVFSAERWELLEFDVLRDDEFIKVMIERENEFWEYVKKGIPPPQVKREDLKMPKITNGEVISLADIPGFVQAVQELREAKSIITEAKELEESAKERLQNLMTVHGAQVAEGGGARIYWKPQKGRITFDWKKLQANNKEMDLTPYIKESEAFRAFRPYFYEGGENE